MKLKTVKDMYLEEHEYYDDEVVCVSELKAEAVKWVKERTKGRILGVNEWCDFFNLTEEDLK